MSEGDSSDPEVQESEAAREESRRKARLDAIFGTALPDDSSGRDKGHDDKWFLENRPPHH
ncbi:hypothetical protein IEU95_03005 [Hoyosella rhizosphaerae]|uniref:hypothetical protein n=1 Tax=Hoyosella rhizosphaerae TaxID=1755582 RepID=UPI00197F248D|nr:hypothetical protein [Hoyosella rhizosphaerae]MBN4925783.1 hypothetical protein [Hoyosella rhizosphaerae]